MRRYLTVAIGCFWLGIQAQDYAASLISTELVKDANAVVRVDETRYTILSIDQAEQAVHFAVTIMNEKGKSHAIFHEWYDKLSMIQDVEIVVYDKLGERISKVKNSDILDFAASSGSLYEDNRVKYHDPTISQYPYTVEYRFVRKYKYLFLIPDKTFYPGQHVAVEKSTYTISFPTAIGVNYKESNFSGTRNEESIGANKSVTWTIQQLPAYEHEAYGPSFFDVVPEVRFTPARFKYENYEGDQSSWDGMARWQLSLNKGRDQLPSSTLAKVQMLTAEKSRLDKIQEIYKYVQQNTRYVSVQLGIGGFQPFPVAVVDEVGYGDCKALSFYTQSLLKAVGIDSYYSWVYGGDNPPTVSKEFPENRFNHIILCVPHERDTIWLECTSQTNPFGYLGKFTGNRKALVINETGGYLVNTTRYPANENVQQNTVSVKISEDGNASVKARMVFSGLKSEYRSIDGYATLGAEKQKDWIKEEIEIPTFDVKSFTLNRASDASVQLSTELFVNKLVSKSGSRFFLQPNVINRSQWIPIKYADRKLPIIEEYGYVETDTVYFELPKSFSVEAYFDPIDILSAFGEYHAEIQSDEKGIKYIRYFRINEGVFEPKVYLEYLEFHKQVVNADKRKISFVTGT